VSDEVGLYGVQRQKRLLLMAIPHCQDQKHDIVWQIISNYNNTPPPCLFLSNLTR